LLSECEIDSVVEIYKAVNTQHFPNIFVTFDATIWRHILLAAARNFEFARTVKIFNKPFCINAIAVKEQAFLKIQQWAKSANTG